MMGFSEMKKIVGVTNGDNPHFRGIFTLISGSRHSDIMNSYKEAKLNIM